MSKEYEFKNCDGQTVSFPGHFTIEDLLKAGVREIRMTPGDAPPDRDPRWYTQWYTHNPEDKK